MIRLATMDDMPDIINIYDTARKYMAQNKNPTQWSDGYPQEDLLKKDIEKGQLLVYIKDCMHGVFVLQQGIDPNGILTRNMLLYTELLLVEKSKECSTLA